MILNHSVLSHGIKWDNNEYRLIGKRTFMVWCIHAIDSSSRPTREILTIDLCMMFGYWFSVYLYIYYDYRNFQLLCRSYLYVVIGCVKTVIVIKDYRIWWF